jgi:phosphatidate cytidylyltransferase
MKDLPRRTLTAAVYGAIVLAAVRGPRELFVVVVVAIAALAIGELVRLRAAGYADAGLALVVATGVAALVYLRFAFAPRPLGCGPDCLWGPLLMTIVAVWAADVTAYVVGSTFGRRKIAPRISPGKTWEGTIAGFVAAGLVVLLWSRPQLGVPVVSLLLAPLIGPVAFAGDLFESWVKRRAGVKDSGTLLPGHGGVLDRIDSLVAAAPLVAVAVAVLDRMG